MEFLGSDTPKLGFGLMRLPQIDGTMDLDQIKKMVDAFMAAGLTYFDTARAYGDSEDAIRTCLVERYPRDSYTLATKCAAWLGAKDAADARAMFETSLEKTGAGYFDYYLLHNLGATRTQVFENYDLWTWARGLKEQGLIKHLGFSMHDTAAALDDVLKRHPEAEFVQLQINYADWENSSIQSRACMEVAANHGKPVVIMEPIRGGSLANPPAAVADILRAANPDASFASWALRFAWQLEGVITVLSGMSTLEQMEQNIASYQARKPLDEQESAAIRAAQEALAKDASIPCTACKYCMKECPQHIDIANIMQALNRRSSFGHEDGARWYGFSTGGHAKASDCIECGQCEEACPQHIDIMTQLKAAKQVFDEQKQTYKSSLRP